MSSLEKCALAIMQGFAANPSIFAPNAMSGWELVNVTEDQLADYAFKLAQAMVDRAGYEHTKGAI